MIRRNKMVSFRITAEEFSHLNIACAAAGVESVSELARESIQHHLSHPTGPRLSLKEEVQSLSAKIDSLTGEVDRLSRLIQSAKSAHA